jgi:UDP-N-acetylglucosamine 2-epimerase (non-hydrolysing)
MRPGQSLNRVCSRIQHRLDPILASERPDAVLVQGDTTTALAGALAAFHQRIPVGHVEAGLRTDDPNCPFPEEMHRRLIARLATWHFAATDGNRQTLLAEGVADDAIFVTGNPVVDALERILARPNPSPLVLGLLRRTAGMRRVVVTMHRRENFGRWMAHSLRALRDFTTRHADVAVLFPVHPNPAVSELANAILAGQPRMELLPPLDYLDFISLLSQAWLVVSDSGGIQEEVPTLGKPLIVLRANTERPEAVAAGFARLVGDQPEDLAAILDECHSGAAWMTDLERRPNPFGDGAAGARIAQALARVMPVRAREVASP